MFMRNKMVYLLLLCSIVVNAYGQKKSQRKFVEPPTLVCGPVAGSIKNDNLLRKREFVEENDSIVNKVILVLNDQYDRKFKKEFLEKKITYAQKVSDMLDVFEFSLQKDVTSELDLDGTDLYEFDDFINALYDFVSRDCEKHCYPNSESVSFNKVHFRELYLIVDSTNGRRIYNANFNFARLVTIKINPLDPIQYGLTPMQMQRSFDYFGKDK